MTSGRTEGRRRLLTSAAFGLLAVGGLILLIWAFAHQTGAPPSPDEGQGLGATTTTATPSAPPTLSSGVQTQDPAANTSSPSSASATTEPAVQALPRSEPIAVRIPTIDVDTALHGLGLDDEGGLQVPSGERYDQAAWYVGSPTPGEEGPAVIEGHVTSQGSVPSVFYDLGALSRGDRIEVEREDGSVATFQVYATDSFPKDDFPKALVYGNTSGPEMRLITCGGVYDPQGRRHLDNIVVFARLIES